MKLSGCPYSVVSFIETWVFHSVIGSSQQMRKRNSDENIHCLNSTLQAVVIHAFENAEKVKSFCSLMFELAEINFN